MTEERYLKRTIIKEELTSGFLQEERTARVYLPPGYQELLSYPVVYCQDGEDFFNFGRIATIANQLILDEDIEPFIIVGADVDKRKRTSEYSPDGERFADYVRFFAEELVPYMEAKYPIRSSGAERILAGDSLGGTISVHIALHYPDLFRRVISLSGAFYPASQERIAAAADLSWLRMYMLVGLQETAFETDRGVFDFVDLNRKTRDLLAGRNADLHYLEKDGRHLWGFWQQQLPDALSYFLR